MQKVQAEINWMHSVCEQRSSKIAAVSKLSLGLAFVWISTSWISFDLNYSITNSSNTCLYLGSSMFPKKLAAAKKASPHDAATTVHHYGVGDFGIMSSVASAP